MADVIVYIAENVKRPFWSVAAADCCAVICFILWDIWANLTEELNLDDSSMCLCLHVFAWYPSKKLWALVSS